MKRYTLGLTLVSALMLSSCASQRNCEALKYDSYRGLKPAAFAPGEAFRIEREGPRWWFVTPEGGKFLSFGVNHVTGINNTDKETGEKPYNQAVMAKYGSLDKWAEGTCARLKEWGFNTIGAWSRPEVNPYLPRTPILNLGGGFWSAHWNQDKTPDFFSPEFAEHVGGKAKGIEEHAGDPMVLGYFIDNEQPWGPDHREQPPIFDGYVAMAAEAPGKQRLVAFFKERYDTIEGFNTVWKPEMADWDALCEATALEHRRKKAALKDRTDFTRIVARKYFEVTTDAIHAKDPGRLVLGCRFIPYSVPKAVVEACGEYCDVVSVNFYEMTWLGEAYLRLAWRRRGIIEPMSLNLNLTEYHEVTGKPLMVTEFTSRIKAKGQNSWPPPYAIQPVVRNEKKRVARYRKQVMTWMEQPWFVGAHWFELADQPVGGRGDGEDSTFGLVKIDDEPYHEFVEGVSQVIREAWRAHAKAE